MKLINPGFAMVGYYHAATIPDENDETRPAWCIMLYTTHGRTNYTARNRNIYNSFYKL